jgi:class 3 adenylate cyclase/tetratricopeptide (TPR) repeat protein
MRCNTCSAENRDGRRFCAQCGAPLQLTCPACGAQNEPGDRFCGACGAELAERPQHVAAPVSERRMVSILFADLVGFTPLTEARDPEQARELLSRYFELATTVVARHGGTVEKFIGDATVAVWGTPVAQEDDAERAVRTALELVAAVPELEPGLSMRAGVSTGEVAVTVGASDQGMVAGDVVNTTARIQAAAPAGGVLMDDATRRSTEAAISCEPAGTHELKGKSEPVALWRALRVVAERGGRRRSRGLEPPFVGRTRELRLVQDLLHSVADQRRAHLVSVIGLAGIGKSRLSWELEKYVDGLADDFLWHRGRCLSYGEGVAFWALAEMVRMRARISDDDDAADARSKLERTLEHHVPDQGERAWIEPTLLHLLGLEEFGEGDRSRLFSAWRLFVERMADTAPVMLVFEDMQWADQALLDFVEYLLEWSRNRPLFVLALTRPELADVRAGWGAASRAHTSLVLEPLPDDAMADLLAGVGVPADVVGPIVKRAEGIPLYAVETVRMLIDRGRLVAAGSGFRATGAVEALEIPETLQALVAARLDTLDDGDRRLLQDASVLGKTFTLDGLSAVSGIDAPGLARRLDPMVRRELLAIETDPRSPEHGQYGFVQALVRTIAYETMGRRDRKRRHLAVADHLASLDQAGELVELVAMHRLDAYRLVPDDDDADPLRVQTRDLLVRAADRARSLGAPQEASRLIASALELSAEQDVRADLLYQAAEIELSCGRAAAGRTLAEHALAFHTERADERASARVLARIADALFLEGRPDEAVPMLQRSYDSLDAQGPSVELAEVAAQLGRMQVLAGRDPLSPAPLERAIDLAEQLSLPDVLSDALNTRGVLATTTRPEYARSLLEGALRIALEHDLPYAAMRAYFNLSYVCECTDRSGTALDQQGIALAHRLGDRQWERSFQQHLTIYELLSGEWDAALAIAEAVQEGAEGTIDTFISHGWLAKAVVLAERGAIEDAREAVASSLVDHTSRDPQLLLMWSWAASTLRLREGDAAHAQSIARGAREGVSEMDTHHAWTYLTAFVEAAAALTAGDRSGAEDLREWLGAVPAGLRPPSAQALVAWLAASAEDGDEADPLYEEAAGLLRSIPRPFHLATVLESQAASLRARGRVEEASARADEAEAIYERLGAAPALERLRGAAGEPSSSSAAM